MRGSRDRVEDATSTVFEGLIAVSDPAQSWVAKWQRLQTYEPGLYATKVVGALPEDVIQNLEDAGLRYIQSVFLPQDEFEKETKGGVDEMLANDYAGETVAQREEREAANDTARYQRRRRQAVRKVPIFK